MRRWNRNGRQRPVVYLLYCMYIPSFSKLVYVKFRRNLADETGGPRRFILTDWGSTRPQS